MTPPGGTKVRSEVNYQSLFSDGSFPSQNQNNPAPQCEEPTSSQFPVGSKDWINYQYKVPVGIAYAARLANPSKTDDGMVEVQFASVPSPLITYNAIERAVELITQLQGTDAYISAFAYSDARMITDILALRSQIPDNYAPLERSHGFYEAIWELYLALKNKPQLDERGISLLVDHVRTIKDQLGSIATAASEGRSLTEIPAPLSRIEHLIGRLEELAERYKNIGPIAERASRLVEVLKKGNIDIAPLLNRLSEESFLAFIDSFFKNGTSYNLTRANGFLDEVSKMVEIAQNPLPTSALAAPTEPPSAPAPAAPSRTALLIRKLQYIGDYFRGDRIPSDFSVGTIAPERMAAMSNTARDAEELSQILERGGEEAARLEAILQELPADDFNNLTAVSAGRPDPQNWINSVARAKTLYQQAASVPAAVAPAVPGANVEVTGSLMLRPVSEETGQLTSALRGIPLSGKLVKPTDAPLNSLQSATRGQLLGYAQRFATQIESDGQLAENLTTLIRQRMEPESFRGFIQILRGRNVQMISRILRELEDLLSSAAQMGASGVLPEPPTRQTRLPADPTKGIALPRQSVWYKPWTWDIFNRTPSASAASTPARLAAGAQGGVATGKPATVSVQGAVAVSAPPPTPPAATPTPKPASEPIDLLIQILKQTSEQFKKDPDRIGYFAKVFARKLEEGGDVTKMMLRVLERAKSEPGVFDFSLLHRAQSGDVTAQKDLVIAVQNLERKKGGIPLPNPPRTWWKFWTWFSDTPEQAVEKTAARLAAAAQAAREARTGALAIAETSTLPGDAAVAALTPPPAAPAPAAPAASPQQLSPELQTVITQLRRAAQELAPGRALDASRASGLLVENPLWFSNSMSPEDYANYALSLAQRIEQGDNVANLANNLTPERASWLLANLKTPDDLMLLVTRVAGFIDQIDVPTFRSLIDALEKDSQFMQQLSSDPAIRPAWDSLKNMINGMRDHFTFSRNNRNFAAAYSFLKNILQSSGTATDITDALRNHINFLEQDVRRAYDASLGSAPTRVTASLEEPPQAAPKSAPAPKAAQPAGASPAQPAPVASAEVPASVPTAAAISSALPGTFAAEIEGIDAAGTAIGAAAVNDINIGLSTGGKIGFGINVITGPLSLWYLLGEHGQKDQERLSNRHEIKEAGMLQYLSGKVTYYTSIAGAAVGTGSAVAFGTLVLGKAGVIASPFIIGAAAVALPYLAIGGLIVMAIGTPAYLVYDKSTEDDNTKLMLDDIRKGINGDEKAIEHLNRVAQEADDSTFKKFLQIELLENQQNHWMLDRTNPKVAAFWTNPKLKTFYDEAIDTLLGKQETAEITALANPLKTITDSLHRNLSYVGGDELAMALTMAQFSGDPKHLERAKQVYEGRFSDRVSRWWSDDKAEYSKWQTGLKLASFEELTQKGALLPPFSRDPIIKEFCETEISYIENKTEVCDEINEKAPEACYLDPKDTNKTYSNISKQWATIAEEHGMARSRDQETIDLMEKRALVAACHAIKNEPEKADTFAQFGKAAYLQNQDNVALTLYQRAVQLDPTNPEFYEKMGDVYKALTYGANDNAKKELRFKAIDSYKKAIDQLKTPEEKANSNLNREIATLYQKLSEQDLKEKNYPAAKEELDQAVVYFRHENALENLYLYAERDLATALKQQLATRKSAGEKIEKPAEQKTWEEIGSLYERNFNREKGFFTKNKEDDSFSLNFDAAEAFYKAGNDEKAISLYEQSLRYAGYLPRAEREERKGIAFLGLARAHHRLASKAEKHSTEQIAHYQAAIQNYASANRALQAAEPKTYLNDVKRGSAVENMMDCELGLSESPNYNHLIQLGEEAKRSFEGALAKVTDDPTKSTKIQRDIDRVNKRLDDFRSRVPSTPPPQKSEPKKRTILERPI